MKTKPIGTGICSELGDIYALTWRAKKNFVHGRKTAVTILPTSDYKAMKKELRELREYTNMTQRRIARNNL